MNRLNGFTLIEVIFFIVISAIAMAGIAPLYMTVLSDLQALSVGMQAEYLGWERLEALKSTYGNGEGFDKLTTANFPAESGLDIGGTVLFDRSVTIEGGTVLTGALNLSCSGQAYQGEPYKCLIVQVAAQGSSSVLFKQRMVAVNLK
ncbi:MAG: type II secretion system protein [Magnetococcales bacterium]|nr:type II secretion system protein [Magnetococcales bacterium]